MRLGAVGSEAKGRVSRFLCKRYTSWTWIDFKEVKIDMGSRQLTIGE
jgi:hypothetical protein